MPIAQDELALSLGYAASLEASRQDYAGNSRGPSSPASDPPAMFPGPLDAFSSPTSVQEADETTHSDISERPSVDDVESETGSTGALETRSLKDHKGGEILAALPFFYNQYHDLGPTGPLGTRKPQANLPYPSSP